MARPWRLRHKLLLGLALMVAILGTLLAGSLLGLDSYIATTKTTDSKLAELQAVEDLRASIGKLTAAAEPNADRANEWNQLKQRIAETRESVERFNEQHRDTLRRSRDPEGEQHVEGLISDLHRFCDQFNTAAEDASKCQLVGERSPLIVDNDNVKATHDKLMKAADELRKTIYDNVY